MKRTPEKSSSQAVERDPLKNQSWYIEQLIAGLDASAQVKLLLFLIRLHQNRKTGCAWASQSTLGREMSVDERNVRRYFAECIRRGFVGVARERKGTRKQFNKYWIIVEGLQACQRPDRNEPNPSDHRTPVSHASTTDHRTPAPYGHRTPVSYGKPDHRTNPAGPQDAGALEGFEVDSGFEVKANHHQNKSAPSARPSAAHNPPSASSNGSASGDDELRFSKAKENFVRKHKGEHLETELAEACELIRKRHVKDCPHDPVRNWDSFLERGYSSFMDSDWKKVRERIAQANRDPADILRPIPYLEPAPPFQEQDPAVKEIAEKFLKDQGWQKPKQQKPQKPKESKPWSHALLALKGYGRSKPPADRESDDADPRRRPHDTVTVISCKSTNKYTSLGFTAISAHARTERIGSVTRLASLSH